VILFCTSNNSDVKVIGSLLLVHCVIYLCRRDKFIGETDSHALTEGHRPRIIGAPIALVYIMLADNFPIGAARHALQSLELHGLVVIIPTL
jgi:hypothetical protein